MSKRHICKSKFHVCYDFLTIYENPRRKNFINPSCPKYLKVINWNEKWHNLIFSHFLYYLKKVSSFWSTKKKCENKNLCRFLPLFWIETTRVKTVFYGTPDLCHFCFLNNRDTQKQYWHLQSSNKQYYKIILFKVFIKWNWHFQRVTAAYYRLFPKKLYKTIFLSLSGMNLF